MLRLRELPGLGLSALAMITPKVCEESLLTLEHSC